MASIVKQYKVGALSAERFQLLIIEYNSRLRDYATSLISDLLIARFEAVGLKGAEEYLVHLHDDYYSGKIWVYDFTLRTRIYPDLSTHCYMVEVEAGETIKDWLPALEGPDVEDITGALIASHYSYDIITRDNIGGVLDSIAESLGDYSEYTKSPNYRAFIQAKEIPF